MHVNKQTCSLKRVWPCVPPIPNTTMVLVALRLQQLGKVPLHMSAQL